MPNTRRFHLASIPQHIVQRGNNRQACFVDEEGFSEYAIRLVAASRKFDVAIHAYVLMSNHVHLLATPTSPDGVSRMMQAVGSGFVRAFNARHARTGTLWDGRYFASLVGGDAYFWNCHRYIELNPVRAGIVDTPAGYRWSSYARNAWGRADPLVTPHPAYLGLAESAERVLAAYRGLFADEVGTEAIADIREQLRRERAYGSEEFLAGVEARAPRSPRACSRGRPAVAKC